MKLPFSFGLKKKEVKSYFLALLLQDEKVGAVVLEESNGAIHVVGHAEERFSSSLEEASFEEWLAVIDKTVSFAEENLPSKIQTEKTVFGVKQDWIIEGKIKRGYLTRLKKICEELSLQPIGFLVFTEAILHMLQKEEGAPVSAILVELGKKFIIISIVRAGRIIETKLIPFEEPVTHSVDNALKEFSVEILPSRIIIFNSEDNKLLTQTFISHSWSKSLPFLHMPQVSVLPATFDTKSVLYGTAAQLGFAVMGADSLPTKTRSQADMTTEKHIEEPEELEKELEEKEEAEEKSNTETPPSLLADTVSADFFGFIQNGDVAKTTPPQKKQPKKPEPQDGDEEEATEEIPEEVKMEETEEFSAGNLPASATMLFAGIKLGIGKILAQRSVKGIATQLGKTAHTVVKQITTLINKADESKTSDGNSEGKSLLPFPTYWLALPAGVLICILLIVFYIFGVSAKITLTANPKVLTSQQPVTFVTDGTPDFDKGILVGQTVSSDEKGSVSQQATGTKQVGTPAKGTVTFYNVSDTASLSAGTTIVASNGKKFTTDKAVNVPSGDPTSAGTASVSVTAADIGPDYNMPSGTKFTINSSNVLGAKNDAAFSGGTKKDIIVVSQADVDKLSSTLISNFEDKARTDLGQQVGSDKMLLPSFTQEDISEKTLDKKVGDEAQTVTLNGTITYQGLVVSKSDLTSFASHVLQIPSDMTLTSDGIHTDLTDIKQSKDSTSGTLNIKASLMPKIDTAQLGKSLAGKSFQEAGDVVKALPQIQSVDFALSPNLPFLPKVLPRLSNHITITVLSQ